MGCVDRRGGGGRRAATLGTVADRNRVGAPGLLRGCQAFYDPEVLSDLRHPLLWAGEVASILGILRGFGGRGWWRASPLVGVVARIWLTFLILAFNAATVNSLTGWSLDWFKLSWCGLSSFGFATMAWLFGARWLIPAVGMSLTGW